jgi:hypothetical protein
MADVAGRELCDLVDQELSRLPDKYRTPFVLCCLEDQSKAAVARQLGWKEGTVSSRLARARDLLRGRLARRGVVLSGGLGAALAEHTAPAAVPAALAAATRKVASLVATGEAASAPVATLAKGMVEATIVSRLKTVAAVLLALTLFATGAGLIAHQAPTGQAPADPSANARTDQTSPDAPRITPTDLWGDPLPAGALARLGTVRLRHGGPVASVAFSPDGTSLISGGHDNTARLWNVASGGEVRRWEGRVGPAARHAWVESVALSADGRTLAAGIGNGGGLLCLWDVATGRELRRWDPRQPTIFGIAFSADGHTIAFGGPNNVRLWDSATGQEREQLQGHEGWVRQVAFAPDGRTFASGSDDRTVRLWDSATGKELYRLVGPSREVSALAFSTDGRKVAASSYDGIVWLWDAATGKKLRHFNGQQVGVFALAFTPDGQILASGGQDRSVRLWDVTTGKACGGFAGLCGFPMCLTYSRDARYLAAGGAGRHDPPLGHRHGPTPPSAPRPRRRREHRQLRGRRQDPGVRCRRRDSADLGTRHRPGIAAARRVRWPGRSRHVYRRWQDRIGRQLGSCLPPVGRGYWPGAELPSFRRRYRLCGVARLPNLGEWRFLQPGDSPARPGHRPGVAPLPRPRRLDRPGFFP